MERADEERWLQTQVQSEASSRAYHLEQVASFGNACGTIAAVHALSNTNLGAPGGLVLDGDSRLAAFCGETVDQTAAERGHKLVTSSHLKTESDEAAEHTLAQTSCPSRDGPALDHHYCAFVPIMTSSGSVHAVELDGTKSSPVDHGAVQGGGADFLDTVAHVVRRRWMSLEPDRVDFSLLALCRPPM